MTRDGDIAAIVLAAGRGTRFGEASKLLAPLHGKPLVRHAVEAALASRASEVVVVLGHRAPEIAAALAGLPVRLVENTDHAAGLSTSLKAGLAAVPPSAAGALVLLGDMPRVTPALLDALIAGWNAGGRPDAAIPTRDGRRGNPVLLSAKLRPEIGALAGDEGAGRLLRGRPNVVELPVDSDAVLLDVDTPAALAEFGDQAPASTTPSRIAE